jgi:hypothetical protein
MLSSKLDTYNVCGEGCCSVRQCIYREMNRYNLVIRPDPRLRELYAVDESVAGVVMFLFLGERPKSQKAVSHGVGIWHDFW